MVLANHSMFGESASITDDDGNTSDLTQAVFQEPSDPREEKDEGGRKIVREAEIDILKSEYSYPKTGYKVTHNAEDWIIYSTKPIGDVSTKCYLRRTDTKEAATNLRW